MVFDENPKVFKCDGGFRETFALKDLWNGDNCLSQKTSTGHIKIILPTTSINNTNGVNDDKLKPTGTSITMVVILVILGAVIVALICVIIVMWYK